MIQAIISLVALTVLFTAVFFQWCFLFRGKMLDLELENMKLRKLDAANKRYIEVLETQLDTMKTQPSGMRCAVVVASDGSNGFDVAMKVLGVALPDVRLTPVVKKETKPS